MLTCNVIAQFNAPIVTSSYFHHDLPDSFGNPGEQDRAPTPNRLPANLGFRWRLPNRDDRTAWPRQHPEHGYDVTSLAIGIRNRRRIGMAERMAGGRMEGLHSVGQKTQPI